MKQRAILWYAKPDNMGTGLSNNFVGGQLALRVINEAISSGVGFTYHPPKGPSGAHGIEVDQEYQSVLTVACKPTRIERINGE